VIRSAKAHVYTVLDLLDRASMSGDTRRRLEAVASDAACLVGYGEMNAGRMAEADGWFADALRLARQAGDRRLEALALASRAWASLYRPDPDHAEVIEALEAAAGFYSFLPPAARAWLFSYLGREHAALGDDLVSGRFLEHTQAAAALVAYEEPGWGWWSSHGDLPIRPALCLATRSLLLDHPAEAIETFNAALESTTASLGRANLHRRLVQGCVALGEPDRACASAHAALDEAKKYELGLWPKEVRKVRMTFPKPWNSLRPVIELDERLALAS
jgi:tetratricopeptide (TPR) repeat protein